MADRYWVGDGGNWSDNTNHWAASSGGAANETKPTSSDNVFFDASSFSSGSQTVTVDESADCLDMDWTGATDSPTITISNALDIFGSLTFILAMTITATTQNVFFKATASGKTVTLNGNTLAVNVRFTGAGGWTLQDAFNTTTGKFILFQRGTLDTNDQTITCGKFAPTDATARTLTLGSSVINCTQWDLTDPSNFTFTANTATIKVTGTGAFDGGGQTAYYNVELNGTAHTISGDNTFAKLSLNPSGAQTITFTDTSTQTVARMERTGTGLITMTGTGAGGWAVDKTGPGSVSLENVTIDECTATPDNMWFFPRSVDGGNNFNIRYVIPYAGSGWWAMRG